MPNPIRTERDCSLHDFVTLAKEIKIPSQQIIKNPKKFNRNNWKKKMYLKEIRNELLMK